MPRRRWAPILDAARAYVDNSAYVPTLREVHYHLVGAAAGLGYENTQGCYSKLSELTAEARRTGSFPALMDRTRSVSWPSPRPSASLASYAEAVARSYSPDLLAGQDQRVVIVVEKRTLLSQLEPLADDYGVPLVALSGYVSQSFVNDVAAVCNGWPGWADPYSPAPTTVLYVGDFDPSGLDIDRDLRERAGVDDIVRLGVNADQIEDLSLPVAFGKPTDSRAAAFTARHGSLVQVETEALSAAIGGLDNLVRPAVERLIDVDLVDAMKDERDQTQRRIREALTGLAA